MRKRLRNGPASLILAFLVFSQPACKAVIDDLVSLSTDLYSTSARTYQGRTGTALSTVRHVMAELEMTETKYSESSDQIEVHAETSDGKPVRIEIVANGPSGVDIGVTVNFGIDFEMQSDFHDELAERLLRKEVGNASE